MELRIQVNLDGEDLSTGGEEAIERVLLEAARKAARMEPGEKRKLLDINGNTVGTIEKE